MVGINNSKTKHVYILNSIYVLFINIFLFISEIPILDIIKNSIIIILIFIFFIYMYPFERFEKQRVNIIKVFLILFFSGFIQIVMKLFNMLRLDWIDLFLINFYIFSGLIFYILIINIVGKKEYNFLIISKRSNYEIVKKILIQFDKKVNKIFFQEQLNKNDCQLNNIDICVIDENLEFDEKKLWINLLTNHDVEVFLIPSLNDIFPINVTLFKIDDYLSFKIKRVFFSPFQRAFKRLFDLFISIIGIFILLPVFIAISILIKVFDNGPVFYYQRRVTINQKEFTVIKFRTMIVDAENSTGAVFARDNDERVTRIGRVLRKTKLDELPQIINIIKGDMSIVGPRPERAFFINQFIKEESLYEERFKVKAGITGLSQINVKYHTSYKDKLRFDLLYIYNYSLLMDIKIIFNTILVIFNNSKLESSEQTKNLDDLLAKYNLERTSNNELKMIISR